MTVTRFVGVGDQVPEMSFPDLDGRQIALSSFAGKKLIIFMWASW
jgi:peroxiredoxin